MEFIAINGYIEHYHAPVDLLMWLYDMAEYRDELAELKRIDAENAKNNLKATKSTTLKKP